MRATVSLYSVAEPVRFVFSWSRGHRLIVVDAYGDGD